MIGFTDGQGRFEIEPLTLGAYVLGINLDSSPDVEKPYARTYYPNARERADAAVIVVEEDTTLDDYTLLLPRALAEVAITGVVTWPEGRPVDAARVVMEDVEYPGRNGSGMSGVTDAEGRFTLRGLEGRRYRVKAVAILKPSGQRHAEPVEVAASGVTKPVRLVVTEPNGNCARCLRY